MSIPFCIVFMMIQMLCLKVAEILLILNRKAVDKFTK
jgi:hypothetical protein